MFDRRGSLGDGVRAGESCLILGKFWDPRVLEKFQWDQTGTMGDRKSARSYDFLHYFI